MRYGEDPKPPSSNGYCVLVYLGETPNPLPQRLLRAGLFGERTPKPPIWPMWSLWRSATRPHRRRGETTPRTPHLLENCCFAFMLIGERTPKPPIWPGLSLWSRPRCHYRGKRRVPATTLQNGRWVLCRMQPAGRVSQRSRGKYTRIKGCCAFNFGGDPQTPHRAP